MPNKRSPGCKCCAPTLRATLTGYVVNSCSTNVPKDGLVNASVTVQSTNGLTTYGTLHTVTDGFYSGLISIPSSPLTVKVTAAIDPADPKASRYQAVVVAPNPTLRSNQTTSLADIEVIPATDFFCYNKITYPLPRLLHLTDTVNGPFTVSWLGSNTWSVTANLDFAGCSAYGTCAAVQQVPCTLSMTALGFQFSYRTFFTCPTTEGTTDTTIVTAATPTINPFSMSAAMPTNNAWYCNGASTWTVTE